MYPSGRKIHAAAALLPPSELFMVVQSLVALLKPSLISTGRGLDGSAEASRETGVPEQIVPVGVAVILTLAGIFRLTVMVTVLEVAGFPAAHIDAPEVKIQVTASLFNGV